MQISVSLILDTLTDVTFDLVTDDGWPEITCIDQCQRWE